MEIIIHQAILHVLDTTLDAPVLSGGGMELTAEKTAYLQNHIEKLLASDEMLRSVAGTAYGKNFDVVRQRLKLECKPGERFVFFYGDRLETNGLGRVFLAHCAMHEDNPFSYCDNYFYYSWKPQ